MVRVLHIVESFDTGAVENWLLRMLGAASQKYPQYRWTFFCLLERPGRLDDEVRRRGGEILPSPFYVSDKVALVSHLRKVLKAGRYDILHCHHDFISALYLCAAANLPIRKKIVHVHNTDESILTPSRVKQALFKELMRQVCLKMSDGVVGITEHTLRKFIRRDPRPGRDSVLHYGIDTARFRGRKLDPVKFRTDLGFRPDAKVLLFVGRMAPIKNPCFLVESLAALSERRSDVVAVFAGAGELEGKVLQLAKGYGLEDRVRVLGWRDDTDDLMLACDAFVFPRLEEPKEGLGLVIVEAEAAGLPIIASPSLAEDVFVVPELFQIVPLAAGTAAWAEAIDRALSGGRRPGREESLRRIDSSPFSLSRGLDNLMSLYE